MGKSLKGKHLFREEIQMANKLEITEPCITQGNAHLKRGTVKHPSD